jgi:hypothetical protein
LGWTIHSRGEHRRWATVSTSWIAAWGVLAGLEVGRVAAEHELAWGEASDQLLVLDAVVEGPAPVEEIHYTSPIPGIDETVHVARISREARGLPAFAIVIGDADEGSWGNRSGPSNR